MVLKTKFQIALFLGILSIFLSTKGLSQNLIAVQNGNTPAFFTALDSAITQAQNGDTLFLPGGGFTISVPISKSIHIVGVGHHPDSTTATNRTLISGQLNLQSGADNGSITGIYFTSAYFSGGGGSGQINFASVLNGYKITRCYISGGISATNAQNLVIQENIIYSYSGNWWSINISEGSSLITNNIILGRVNTINSLIKNNDFLFMQYFSASALESRNSTIENNVFQPGTQWAYNFNSIFLNNLNFGENSINSNGSQGSGNLFIYEPLDSIFVNYSTSIPDWVYASNFRIRPNLPFVNGGTDGTQLGIYGGSFPWKEGSVPFNPHVQFKNVPNVTDQYGNLPVNIKVAAQDN